MDRPVRILLIDRDETSPVTLRQLLAGRPADATLDWACTREEGLDMLAEERHDVCLLDAAIDGSGGLSVLGAMRTRDGAPPIVLLTGPGDEATEDVALRAGAADHLRRDELDARTLERSMRLAHLHGEHQKALRTTERRLREARGDVCDAASDGVLDWDLSSGHADGPALRALVDLDSERLVACDDALASLVGRPAAELSGTGLFEIHDPTCAARLREALDRLTSAKEVRDVELLLANDAGGVRDVSLRLTKLSRAGRVHARATWSDISRRKETERRLVTFARELERSNRELQEFAYVASHDLREPLRMVSSYLQLLERRYADRLDQDAREFIGFAVDGARRMRQLITDLLEYSRIGNAEISREPVETRELVNDVLRDLSPAIEDADATLEIGELPRVTADSTHLRRVFQNLIANALKFRSARSPVISIQGEPYGVDWVFSITDNGIGIPAAECERVFQVFQRLHGSDRYGGTGVGLAICKKTIERHGGRIQVQPVPGGGSQFSFTIPRVEAVTHDVRSAA